jgi:hypothetical protein
VAYHAHVLRRLALATFAASLLASGPLLGAAATEAGAAPTAPLTAVVNADGSRTLEWTLQGSSDQINVLPNLRCEMGPAGSTPQFPASDPCLWLVDHLAPLPAGTPVDCLASREPGVGGPAPYASWRCDMRRFRDVVIHAAQNAGDRSFVMFNTTANGGSGVCATIPITVLLGSGSGELQASDGCAQTIRCAAGYKGKVTSDPLDAVTGCPPGADPQPSGAGAGSGAGNSSGGGPGTGGGGAVTPPTSGRGRGGAKTPSGKRCPGASSGKKGNSPLYSVYIKARGKRGMKIYVHMRRAVPITVDVRMRRGNGRTPKIVRWVSRCAKKGTNVITLRNATGGAKSRRNYKVYVKSPNSTYPLRSSWEALPRW